MMPAMREVAVQPKPVAACILLAFAGLLQAGNALNVRDFGAAGDGVKDDTQAIQRTINALPSSGGEILLPAGRYRVRRTLTIGDGSIYRSSSSHNLSVLGAGMGSTADSGFPDEGAAELFWDGAAGATMLQINGPISAVRIEGVRFSARNQAGTCLEVRHAYLSTFRRLQCSDFTAAAFTLDSYSSVPSVAIGANNNKWEQLFAWSAAPGAKGLVLGSYAPTGPGILGASGNQFDSLGLHVNGQDATGIELRFTDFDSFTQVSVLVPFGTGLKVVTTPGAIGFPGAIWFYQSSFIAKRSTDGGYNWSGNEKIFFWPWHIGDGEEVPIQPWAAGITSTGRFFGFYPFW